MPFADKPPTHLFIATPAHGQQVTVTYLKSVMELQKRLLQLPVPIEISMKIASVAIIDLARNYLATLALEEPKYSHILFVDSDQGFQPELILDMLKIDKPIVSAVIASKKLEMSNVWKWARKLDSTDRLLSLSLSYILPEIEKNELGQIPVAHGFVKAKAAGTGIMLVKREVLQAMAELPGIWGKNFQPLIDEGYSGRLLQCFRPVISADNIPVGEDLSFCQRWVEDCHGEIWLNVLHEISHVGPFDFKGRFVDRFIASGALPEAILDTLGKDKA